MAQITQKNGQIDNEQLFNLLENALNESCQNDLSEQTQNELEYLLEQNCKDEILNYAMRELLYNFAKNEFESENEKIEISDFQLNQSIHSTFDYYLHTSFF